MENKRQHGQYFTKVSPLSLTPVQEWLQSIPEGSAIEPFAGENSLVYFMEQLGNTRQWQCYDIEPAKSNLTPQFPVQQQDTISNFPTTNAVLCVTNPPYLAKNSATRRGLSTQNFKGYTDLYQVGLQQCLDNVPYVAAIIPESFITSSFSKKRCSKIVSLPQKLFEDTDHPVCIALFNPEDTKAELFSGETFLGRLDQLVLTSENMLKGPHLSIRYNEPTGEWGARLVDTIAGPSIKVINGTEIPEESIKPTSRAITKFNIKDTSYSQDKADLINNLIDKYRNKTQDTLLTSFKGVRKDGKYRRRLDFSTLTKIISRALAD